MKAPVINRLAITALGMFLSGFRAAPPKVVALLMRDLADAVAHFNARRVQIQVTDQRGNAQVINAFVPLANMFGYINTLRSMSQGRGNYTMQYDHYEEVPRAVADEMVQLPLPADRWIVQSAVDPEVMVTVPGGTGGLPANVTAYETVVSLPYVTEDVAGVNVQTTVDKVPLVTVSVDVATEPL